MKARHAGVASLMMLLAAMLAFAQQAAPELSGDDQRAWFERLEHDHDNLRAALDWSVSRPDPALGARL